MLSSHHINQDEDVYHSETGQAFYLTEPPLLLMDPTATGGGGGNYVEDQEEIGPFKTT